MTGVDRPDRCAAAAFASGAAGIERPRSLGRVSEGDAARCKCAPATGGGRFPQARTAPHGPARAAPAKPRSNRGQTPAKPRSNRGQTNAPPQVQRDFDELPPGAVPALRDSLFALLLRFAAARAAAVRTQLALALAALAAHVPAAGWGEGGALRWFAERFASAPGAGEVGLSCMLEMLTVLPQASPLFLFGGRVAGGGGSGGWGVRGGVLEHAPPNPSPPNQPRNASSPQLPPGPHPRPPQAPPTVCMTVRWS